MPPKKIGKSDKIKKSSGSSESRKLEKINVEVIENEPESVVISTTSSGRNKTEGVTSTTSSGRDKTEGVTSTTSSGRDKTEGVTGDEPGAFEVNKPLAGTPEEIDSNYKKIDKDDVMNIIPEKEKLYMPLIYRINENKIIDFDIKPTFGKTNIYPSFANGFQHFLYATKIEFTSKISFFEKKKKVYLVMNQFEPIIDNYDADINTVTKTYIDTTETKKNGFYKLWELFMMFDIIDLEKSNFITAHINDISQSYSDATDTFRTQFAGKGVSIKNDQMYILVPHEHSKKGNARVIYHNTYSKEESRLNKQKDNGDITNLKTINNFSSTIKNKANLVTATNRHDGNIAEEQNHYKTLIAEIITALKIQAKNGNFICKVYETFTDITIKLIMLLACCYEKVNIVKPLISREFNPEKFVVCQDFKFKDNDKSKTNIINMLEELLAAFDNNNYLLNIFPDYALQNNYVFIHMNKEMSNKYYKSTNEIMNFINKDNFYGDEYKKRREIQINASKYWISLYYPNNFEKIKLDLEKQTERIAGFCFSKAKELSSVMSS